MPLEATADAATGTAPCDTAVRGVGARWWVGLLLGPALSLGGIEGRNQKAYSPYSPATWRAWEHWANKCGCGHMVTNPDSAASEQ